MGFFKKLSGLFAAPPSNEQNAYHVTVKCNRCGEVIKARVNLFNDLSLEYDSNGNLSSYICHKVIVGDQRCYQPSAIILTCDSNRRLQEKEITGGQFVEGPVS
jgi:hypothetical protein